MDASRCPRTWVRRRPSGRGLLQGAGEISRRRRLLRRRHVDTAERTGADAPRSSDARDDIDVPLASRVGLLRWRVERSAPRHYAGRLFATASSAVLRGAHLRHTVRGEALRRVPGAAGCARPAILLEMVVRRRAARALVGRRDRVPRFARTSSSRRRSRSGVTRRDRSRRSRSDAGRVGPHEDRPQVADQRLSTSADQARAPARSTRSRQRLGSLTINPNDVVTSLLTRSLRW